MQPNNLQPVFFDPIHNKLLGQRANGRYNLVDVDGLTVGLDAGEDFFLLKPGIHSERYIDLDVPTGKHYLFYIADEDIHDYKPPTNNTYTVTNIGEGTLEFASLELYSGDATIQSANGLGLNPNASCVLRYRGNNKWHVSGNNGPTTAKTYSVNATANTGTPPPSNLFNFNGEGLTNVQAPTIQLGVNQELILNINAPGHPVVIQPNLGTGTWPGPQAGAYLNHNMGNGGIESGTLKFRAFNTGTWYYNCQYHAGMGGQIVVS